MTTTIRATLCGASSLVLFFTLTACGSGGGNGGDGNDNVSYTVSASANSGGAVSPASQDIDEGDTASFTVTPDTGFILDDIDVAGCSGSMAGNTYTTNTITSDCTIDFSFAPQTFTVSAAASSGGSISPGSRSVTFNDTTTFTVSPDLGFNIASVSGCDGNLSGTTYTTGEVTGDCSVVASFSIQAFTVSTSTGTGGSIEPSNPNVNYGATASLTITPENGYDIDSVSGCAGSLSGNTYTTGSVTGDCTVTASFALQTFTVSTNAENGGTISPSGDQVLDYGESTSFTITPDTNYEIDSVSGCSGSVSGNTYTIGAVSTNCTVTASFKLQSYTVSTSVGTGGTITPENRLVVHGNTIDLTVTPIEGYVIDTVTGCGGTLNADTFTTDAITGPCTVSVSFNFAPEVSALFPNNGANWNDYVEGSDYADAIDETCQVGITSKCVHAGVLKKIGAGRASCAGLSATDDLGAFDWVCDDTTGNARFISTGLAEQSHLSDLLDFSTLSWLENSVTLYDNGNPYASTSLTTWWNNSVQSAGDGSAYLRGAGTIYVVASNVNLVDSYTITASGIALVSAPGAVIHGPGTGVNVTQNFSGDNFLWIETTIDATNDGTAIFLSLVHFSRLDNIRTENGAGGIALSDGFNNIITGSNTRNHSQSGVRLYTGSNNVLRNVTASNCGFRGVVLENSSNNTLSNVTSINNTQAGIQLWSGADNNVLSAINSANNGAEGVRLWGAANNILSIVTVSNNGGDGIYGLGNSHSNVLIGITAANNGGRGIFLSSTMESSLSTLVLANNGNGIELNQSSQSTLADLAVVHNGSFGVYLNNAWENIFTGLFLSADQNQNCSVNIFLTGLTNPGLDDDPDPTDVLTDSEHIGDCTQQGNSDFGVASTANLVNSFTGKVSVDDLSNSSDTNGTANYPTDPNNFDWTSFDNTFRSWGKDGSSFPLDDNRSRWTTGNGVIWDWSLRAADFELRDVLSLPTGDHILTHTWEDNTTSIFLRHAVEIQGDGIGNDNTLCESNETCLFTPNIGSYQGHGDLISAGTFIDGTLTGITLLQYETNGR
jgi:hypothetical protein